MNCPECGSDDRLRAEYVPEHTRQWIVPDEGRPVMKRETCPQALDYFCGNCDAEFTVYDTEFSTKATGTGHNDSGESS